MDVPGYRKYHRVQAGLVNLLTAGRPCTSQHAFSLVCPSMGRSTGYVPIQLSFDRLNAYYLRVQFSVRCRHMPPGQPFGPVL